MAIQGTIPGCMVADEAFPAIVNRWGSGSVRRLCAIVVATLLVTVGAGAVPRARAPLYFSHYQPAPTPGQLTIANTVRRSNCKKNGRAERCQWQGEPFADQNKLSDPVARELKKVFNFPLGKEEADAIELPPLLVQVLVHLSDTFSGAPICLVSGYRCKDCNKFQKSTSRHITAHAADVVFLGVDNADLATYLLYLNESDERFQGKLGIGYYPNQEHVHVDVRSRPMYWVDKSVGGTPADYASNSLHPMDAFFKYYDARRAPARRGRGCPDLSELVEGESELDAVEEAPYQVQWRNILFTEPPSRGTPSSRRKFIGKTIDFALLPQLEGLDQL